MASLIWQEWMRVLSRHNTSIAEYYLFGSITFGLCDPDSIASFTSAESSSFNRDPITVEEAEAALTSCLAKGWLRIVDDLALAEIRSLLQTAGITAVEHALPQAGEVDFTPAGAWHYRQLCIDLGGEEDVNDVFYTEYLDGFGRHFASTLSRAVWLMEDSKADPNVLSISEPSPTGPWCRSWWERFPDGYRVDFTFRRVDEDTESVSR